MVAITNKSKYAAVSFEFPKPRVKAPVKGLYSGRQNAIKTNSISNTITKDFKTTRFFFEQSKVIAEMMKTKLAVEEYKIIKKSPTDRFLFKRRANIEENIKRINSISGTRTFWLLNEEKSKQISKITYKTMITLAKNE